MKRAVSWVLYATSLTPLYFLLIAESLSLPKRHGDFSGAAFCFLKKNFWPFSNETRNICLSFLLFLILAGISIGLYIKRQYNDLSQDKDVTSPEISIADYSIDRVDTMSYVGTYIVPMLTMDVNSIRSITVNILLLVILGKFYVMNSQIYINPLFNIFGLNVYRAGEKYFLTNLSADALIGRVQRKGDLYTREIISNLFLIK
ncbi:hypothetical protein OGL96_02645 [Lacticaseibacillus paracasei]|uniref:hypothetical protein n=1 Tax=Lacticaseibacillus paracasei TaxID=1597 RepID=UPI0021E86813|nr:hypothetical protein [Lacticaseibacillus paracasei]UYI60628.1 hypothetical protein OGL96_02645 [Lacticaseibacillus paracasei]